jgi:hypothetical protein
VGARVAENYLLLLTKRKVILRHSSGVYVAGGGTRVAENNLLLLTKRKVVIRHSSGAHVDGGGHELRRITFFVWQRKRSLSAIRGEKVLSKHKHAILTFDNVHT